MFISPVRQYLPTTNKNSLVTLSNVKLKQFLIIINS